MALQIYFFSCTLLVLVGVFLSYEKFGAALKVEAIFSKGFLENKTIAIILGIGAIFFGLLLLLSKGVSVEGGQKELIFIGNIVPALLGIIGGLALVFSKMNKTYEGEKKSLRFVQGFVQANIAIIGVLMVVSGIVHAVFPSILFL